MATYSRREVHTTRVEFTVPAPYPDGACWVEVYKAVGAAINEMRERGLIADEDEPADNELFISPGDSEVIVAFRVAESGRWVVKGAGKAFVLGGSLAAFFYLTVRVGMDLGFRAAEAVQRRREARERTET